MRGYSVHRLTLLCQGFDDPQTIILQFYMALVLLDAKENAIQHRTPFRMRTILVLKIGLEEAVFLSLDGLQECRRSRDICAIRPVSLNMGHDGRPHTSGQNRKGRRIA